MSESFVCPHGTLLWQVGTVSFEVERRFETRGWRMAAWDFSENGNRAAAVHVTREEAQAVTGMDNPTINDLAPFFEGLGAKLVKRMTSICIGDVVTYIAREDL